MASATSDKIEKRAILKAPIARVWSAISDSREFGQWFGVTLDGPFVVGQTVRGTFPAEITKELMEEAQQRLGLPASPVKAPEKNAVFCTVERVEVERCLAFRWMPFGVDDCTTLVEFTLEKQGQDTLLTIVESGFDKVPAHLRVAAFRMNDHGWGEQANNIARHVESRVERHVQGS